MSEAIDWRRAARRAGALARPGPAGTPAELRAVVTALRRAAVEAPRHVAQTTGLHEAAERAAAGPVHVIDRPRWAEANVAMISGVLDTSALPAASGLGSVIAGEELGVMLAALSSRVLGQYDPFTHDDGGRPGRLLLVAPNVLKIERELDLDALDFRLWVCLHEQTHAVQFAAAPWLAAHLQRTLRALTDDLGGMAQEPNRLGDVLRGILDTVAGRDQGERQPLGGPLLESLLSETEAEGLAELVAIMSLLEGHADVVMDAVDPRLLPSVQHIRRSFERRRDGKGVVDVVVRRLLGMDAKVAQYRHGAAFVRSVVAQVGHDGLNAVWSGPENLPRPSEIADPATWVERVHG